MKLFKNLIIFFGTISFAGFLSINYQSVEIRLLPYGLNSTNVVLHLPLFLIILLFTGIGLLFGTIFEYFRAYKGRKLIQKHLNQADKVLSESKHLISSKKSETDEILSLLK
jgi:uncharacterized integral membrane protein